MTPRQVIAVKLRVFATYGDEASARALVACAQEKHDHIPLDAVTRAALQSVDLERPGVVDVARALQRILGPSLGLASRSL